MAGQEDRVIDPDSYRNAKSGIPRNRHKLIKPTDRYGQAPASAWQFSREIIIHMVIWNNICFKILDIYPEN
jgi:hypothetical protein